MRTKIIEKDSEILVDLTKIPSKQMTVFYNPIMELNRTISILILKTLLKTFKTRELQIALPLAGSGVRAVRMIKELPFEQVKLIAVNDASKDAFELIKENIKLNQLEQFSDKIKIFNKDANKFLEDSFGFDYIDIDPFGSPNFLLDASLRRISRKGILAVTATDTGALNGAFPSAGRMKYWAETTSSSQKHEVGIRILARRIILEGLSQQKVLEPILTYHHKHYYRIFFKVSKSKTKASDYLKQVTKFLFVCDKCGFSSTSECILGCPNCNDKTHLRKIGPLFSGTLNDEKLVKKMLSLASEEYPESVSVLNKLLIDSRSSNNLLFDTHRICEKNKLRIPKLVDLIGLLRKKGFEAEQSIFLKTGIKTDACFQTVLKCIKEFNK